MTIVLDARSRGKNRERADGNGGASGVLLSMDMVSTTYYGVQNPSMFPISHRSGAYTVPVQVGSPQQNLSLQVDTGSSDLWIASKLCSSSSCSAISGRLYDPSSSQSSGATFAMQYLSGSVDGPIVWDKVQIGGYNIPNQALAAATTVDSEPLSYNFDGILGLALPLNSLIQQIIPASSGDAPNGATFSSNLFSLTPTTDAPSQPFLSLTLARPGSNELPSLLGIGLHPPQVVPDPSKINYSPLVSGDGGVLFWKTTIRAITVYVDGQAYPIGLESLSGSLEPTALLDSGVPLIITTPVLANGIYGALGISPASDGNYYVPCAIPLNMTITLDGQNEIPLHPLDLTTEPVGQSNSQYCTGLIQTDPSQLMASADIGDMILGVPFMRNVYTVLAYEQPDTHGNFNNTVNSGTDPTLGLLGLTNATQALQEFNQVRVLGQPLGGSSQQSSSAEGSGPQLSIGVKVLIALVGFFVLCVAFFALRCIFGRRRWRKPSRIMQAENPGPDQKTGMGYDTYCSMRKSCSCLSDDDAPELGVHTSGLATLDVCDPWDPYAGTWRDTIVGTEAGESVSCRSSYFPPADHADGDSPDASSPELTSALLAEHNRSDSQTSDVAEFGMHLGGMAGIGTAARGSILDPGFQLGRPSSEGSIKSTAPLRPTVSSFRLSYIPNSEDLSRDANRTF